MAVTRTTLAADFSANSLTFAATAATGATVGGLVRIDNEMAVITAISGTSITVRSRGDLGTKAVAHDILAPVAFCVASDLAAPAPAQSQAITADNRFAIVGYGEDGAIALPARHTVAVLRKATAAAMTLADPGVEEDGVMLHIVSRYAAAHTITLTTGYGGSNATDVFTMSGASGDSVTLIAVNGVWSHMATGLTAAEANAATVA